MIKDIATLRKLIPTITGNGFEKYRQPVANAKAWLKNKVVGRDIMRTIEELGEDEELFVCARLVVAYRAYLSSIADNDLVETANGFAVAHDEKFVVASSTRVAELHRSMERHLNEALEQLIECLEDTTDYRAAWRLAPMCTIMYESYLPTLRLFRRFGPFAGDYPEFIAALPRMRAVIIDTIEPVISRELSAEIISQVRTGALTENNALIIDDLRFALAGYFNQDARLGETSLFRARRRIEANSDDYPAFRGSELYALITEKKESDSTPKPILPII